MEVVFLNSSSPINQEAEMPPANTKQDTVVLPNSGALLFYFLLGIFALVVLTIIVVVCQKFLVFYFLQKFSSISEKLSIKLKEKYWFSMDSSRSFSSTPTRSGALLLLKKSDHVVKIDSS